ncbi:protein of unknown function [Shinella sp. WSC3-e]|nr:hypothetical protein SHINE37_40806 [Rhizobiaceae bacterium]CAK7255479.1 protein of unknown function [Shinella sp. WSC3-e]
MLCLTQSRAENRFALFLELLWESLRKPLAQNRNVSYFFAAS